VVDDSERDGAAACVTVNVTDALPAVNVTTPVLAAPGLAATRIDGLAPVAPAAGDTDSHPRFEEADQDAWLVVTVTSVDWSISVGFQVVADNDRNEEMSSLMRTWADDVPTERICTFNPPEKESKGSP